MRDPGDLTSVDDPHRYRHLQDDELVRLVVLHRDRGDHVRLRAVWEALLVSHADRIAAWAALFTFPDGSRLSADDREEAVSRALERFAMRLVETFAGTSVGELRAATKRLTEFACRDVGRRTLRRERHETALTIGGAADEDVPDRVDPRLLRDAEWQAQDEEEARHAAERLDRALARLPNTNQAAVLRMDRDGYTNEEIMAELDVSRDNAYQLRKRGLDKLRELLSDDES